ncbi:NAD(P)/FAD-dependent oxidoreductase [Aquimarina algicola]|uniref:FAD-binding oxidoreductase n=1 Tax=Aquimarina algicola TaxID=2589995 RepID=A0A504JHA6_9FLAO|nr:FAD-dependent oxidoreductase [Aquimarina algicola]TPN87178.1 FAD-binding oxidoreductase [Aquimarina algicola]
MLDYIIVGLGLSGLAFVDKIANENKSYVVFEDFTQKSSRVAGGLCNPLVLKRFTVAWQANEQMKIAVPFYQKIQNKIGKDVVLDLPILRRFNSVEEQNTWFEACDKPILNDFLYPELIRNSNEALDIPFHYGRVKHTRKIDLAILLSSYLEDLDQKGNLIKDSFEHDKLLHHNECVEYKNIKAKHIVFCEGFGVHKNPFFNYLPIYGNKGEYIIIKSERLQLKEILKSSVFIIPVADDLYKVGATYNNKDISDNPTNSAKEELVNKLKKVIKVPFEVVDQVSGIRPAVKDRRPILGTHPSYKNIHILNGMGSRGILAAPVMARALYNHIEKKYQLPVEVSLHRFDKAFELSENK